MPDTVSKTDNFLKAIEKYAEEQRNQIQSEAETFKERELNKAEEEGLREAYALLQRKMARINTKISTALSKAEGESKKKLYKRRREIHDEVFKKAEAKLLDYIKTDKYIHSLENSVRLISEKLDGEVVLYVSKNDMKNADKIKKAFGRACNLSESKEIKLGGVMGYSAEKGIVIDETLDTKLSQQHEWFTANSGLMVTEN